MSNIVKKWSASGIPVAALAIAGCLLAASAPRAADPPSAAKVTPVFAQKLPNVPGKSLTAVLVSYAPGGKSGKHHHAGSVFADVVSGAIRSQTSVTGPAKIYHAGESFFEPSGAEHLVSENASATEPASLLAVIVADTGAQLTTPDK